ncbi:MAG: nicotinate-nucleotide--dimethylbenzimidazole phosphoribosyltransferase [Chloroflexota bacterium]
MSVLEKAIQTIGTLNENAIDEATQRQSQLTKPAGSLGKLETISVQMAGITGRMDPPLKNRRVVVMAGDHGVTTEGVSAFPSEVTPQMVYNFLGDGAAINVLAKQAKATVTVVDMGVGMLIESNHPQFLDRKVAAGTQNMATSSAMSRDQAVQAIETGILMVDYLIDNGGLDILVTGDMGIGNTTPSTAIASVILDRSPAEIAGRGTGIDDATLQHKISVIERAITLNQPDASDALDILSKVGGFEIGGIAGLILGAATHRIPVIVDGFISTAGALIASRLAPASKPFMMSGHQSAEVGHQAMLQHLGLPPLIDLDLRLGEGTGAVLALHIVEAAVRTLNDMATFAEASVTNKD